MDVLLAVVAREAEKQEAKQRKRAIEQEDSGGEGGWPARPGDRGLRHSADTALHELARSVRRHAAPPRCRSGRV
jgi:hypothetical protein